MKLSIFVILLLVGVVCGYPRVSEHVLAKRQAIEEPPVEGPSEAPIDQPPEEPPAASEAPVDPPAEVTEAPPPDSQPEASELPPPDEPPATEQPAGTDAPLPATQAPTAEPTKPQQNTKPPPPPTEPPKLTLEDKVINKTDYATIAEVQGSRLYIWEDDTYTPSKFFVTPLGILNTTTIRCDQDYNDASRYVFYFDIHVWNQNTKKIAEAALIEKGFPAETADILPLPMPEIRPGIHPDLPPQIQYDTRWIENENQPNTIAFQLYTEDKAFCDKLVFDAKTTPNSFLGRTKLYYEFRMSIGSPHKQQVIIWTVDKNQSDVPNPIVCDQNRIDQLLNWLKFGTDPLQREAWLKELADLINACDGVLSPESEQNIIDLEPVIPEHTLHLVKFKRF